MANDTLILVPWRGKRLSIGALYWLADVGFYNLPLSWRVDLKNLKIRDFGRGTEKMEKAMQNRLEDFFLAGASRIDGCLREVDAVFLLFVLSQESLDSADGVLDWLSGCEWGHQMGHTIRYHLDRFAECPAYRLPVGVRVTQKLIKSAVAGVQ